MCSTRVFSRSRITSKRVLQVCSLHLGYRASVLYTCVLSITNNMQVCSTSHWHSLLVIDSEFLASAPQLNLVIDSESLTSMFHRFKMCCKCSAVVSCYRFRLSYNCVLQIENMLQMLYSHFSYGVATISRLLEIIGLFCRI